jgi:hypothetical protein
VLTAGRECVERLAVHEVKLHVLREHPRLVFLALRTIPLRIQLLGRRDDAVADALDVTGELRVGDDGGFQAGMRLVRLADDGLVAGAARADGAGNPTTSDNTIPRCKV